MPYERWTTCSEKWSDLPMSNNWWNKRACNLFFWLSLVLFLHYAVSLHFCLMTRLYTDKLSGLVKLGIPIQRWEESQGCLLKHSTFIYGDCWLGQYLRFCSGIGWTSLPSLSEKLHWQALQKPRFTVNFCTGLKVPLGFTRNLKL